MKFQLLLLLAVINMFTTVVLATQYGENTSENKTMVDKDDNVTSAEHCKVFLIENGIKDADIITFATIAAICILAGVFVTFVGYRYLRTSLFIKGVALASFVTYTVCGYYTGLSFFALIGISIFIGVVFAVVSVLITIFGLFLSGFIMGFFTGLALLMAISPFVTLTSKWIPFGILLGFSLLFALLILKFQKKLSIGSTAMFGGILTSISVDFYVEKFLLLKYAWQRILAEEEGDSCWFSWIILSIWPLFFIIGFIIQYKLTAKNVDHKGKDKNDRFYGSEKAVKRYTNMNKSGDVVTTSWLRDKKNEESGNKLIEDVTNV